MGLVNFAILSFLLPVFGFIFQAVLRYLIYPRDRISDAKSVIVPITFMGLSAFFAWVVFLSVVMKNDPGFVDNLKLLWFSAGDGAFKLEIGFVVDLTSATVLMVVSTIAFLIHLFSYGYMRGLDGNVEDRYPRFFGYISLFTASMLGFVISSSLLNMFIFWELMGLCSYLLIGFYFFKKSAANAAVKAFTTTRVGDLALFLGIIIIFTFTGTFMMFGEGASGLAGEGSLFYILGERFSAGDIGMGLLTTVGVLIFFGAVGKSAQFPLHVWLPDAMEGPTPVSALIHAATMVAAGVFLTARVMPLLTPGALSIIALIGGFTALFAASIAIVQSDIKKVLAYSTISQLGFMMLAVGVGNYTAAIFHLMTHAFFKGLLFMSSGSIIHAMRHEADMSQMGGLIRKLPWTFLTFLIGTLALVGIPGFSGFYSKEAILFSALFDGSVNTASLVGFFMGLVAAGFTGFYMFRLIFKTFFGVPKNFNLYNMAKESRWVIITPLMILAGFALCIGWPFGQKFHFDNFFEFIFSSQFLTPTLSLALVIYYISLLWKHGAFNAKQTGISKPEDELRKKEYIPQHKQHHEHIEPGQVPANFRKVPVLPYILPLIFLFVGALISSFANISASIDDIPMQKIHSEKIAQTDDTHAQGNTAHMPKSGIHGWFGHFVHLTDYRVHQHDDFVGQQSSQQVQSPIANAATQHEPTEHASGSHNAFHMLSMIPALLVAAFGIFLAWFFFVGPKAGKEFIGYRGFLAGYKKVLKNLYFVDWFFERVFIRTLHWIRKFIAFFDLVVIDSLVNIWTPIIRTIGKITAFFDLQGVDGSVRVLGESVLEASKVVKKVQTGNIRDYIMILLVSVILLSLLFIFLAAV
ncbi:MAG: NADH-quinone oxidoreductase subunit L [Planctomycetes bacterium]|nr:NADH-quinone oxidoreductase subunit L [Planctomycetota bacterium]